MQIKSPLIKRLRKAGYGTSEAKDIYIRALVNYRLQRHDSSLRNFNMLANKGCITEMFIFCESREKGVFWWKIEDRLRGN